MSPIYYKDDQYPPYGYGYRILTGMKVRTGASGLFFTVLCGKTAQNYIPVYLARTWGRTPPINIDSDWIARVQIIVCGRHRGSGKPSLVSSLI
jgi:hypothetical protein